MLTDFLDGLGQFLEDFVVAAFCGAQTYLLRHEGPPAMYFMKPPMCRCGNCIERFVLSEGQEMAINREFRMLVVPLEAPPDTIRGVVGQWIVPS